ncbi:LacI family DNA-binding transcriptional regulator [Promicromonospora sukumoe]
MTTDHPEPTAAATRASIRDVAERAGVSVSTVSRILNGNYPPAPTTRGKVLRAVQELNYSPNPHARALTGTESSTVAIVVRQLDDGFLLALVQAIATAVADAGMLCLIGTTGNEPGKEAEVLRQMHGQHVRGVIVVGAVEETDEYRDAMTSYIASLDRSRTRLVLCARPPVEGAEPHSVVQYDNTGGAYAATSHLVSRGHRRILLLGGPPASTISKERRAGYRKALADLGVPFDPALEVGPAWDRASGRAVLSRLDRSSFTAVLAHTDQVAAGAMQYLREQGLRLPRDMSFVGFDDSPVAADLDLTSVRIPSAELGRTAVRMLLASDAREEREMFATHVVVRESVAALPA